jgi:aspartyl-tRNA(Asn)/glutamyl-tRNA(Gln) amidotransferase subunit C
MTLKMHDLDAVAALAHLQLEPDEKKQYLSQLGRIFEYMEQLNKLDLSGVTPTLHASDMETPLREDVVVAQPDLMLQKNAPAWENGCFRVPKILD